MHNDEYIKTVIEKLKTIKGIESIFLINQDIKNKIIELEEEANGKVLMGMGIGDNQGIKVAFKKKYLLAVITNKEYKWPKPPNVIMMQNETIIGFDCTKEEIKQYSKNSDYSVFGSFVMIKKKVPNAKGKPIVVLPSKNFDELNDICTGINSVIASPSTPSDEYIYKIFNVKKNNENGTIIVGFD